MHDSCGMEVYLSCPSRPIIENSTGIGFSRYLGVIGETVGIDAREEEWYIKGLVEDFNWLRREHSPNWSLSEGKFSKDTWSMVLRNIGISDVNSILDLVISR